MAEDQFDFFSLFQRNKIKESFYETSFPVKKEENGGTFFEKFEDIPFKAETRQEQTGQGKLTDPIKAKLSLKERLFKIFGKK